MKTHRKLLLLSVALAGAMAMTIAGCNKTPDSTGAPPPAITVGTELDDGVITAKVKSALLADDVVRSFEFKVETRKGEVQLSGFAANQVQIDRAIEIVDVETAVADAGDGFRKRFTIHNCLPL